MMRTAALLATWAWAVPDNGKSQQWTYALYPVDFPQDVPCIGEEVLVQGTDLMRWNLHMTPAGEKSYTLQLVGGDVVITVPSTGKQYFLREGRCIQENARAPFATGGDWGTDTWHVVFEAEDGSRLIHHGIALFEATGDPQNPWAFKKFVWTFSCK